jgi:2-oxo-4-hydroxy-4-carboxy-5-ureidoimidazoline decarboxylase
MARMSSMHASAALARLNLAGPEEAHTELSPCCASGRWIEDIIAGRPYVMLESLVAASDASLHRLTWPDIELALAAHPKIGAAATGNDRESAWSRQEQAGATTADDRQRDRLAEGNLAYQERFGYVFLICASGRSAGELLAALEQRLGNDPQKEQDVVREELTAIVRLRLEKAFG